METPSRNSGMLRRDGDFRCGPPPEAAAVGRRRRPPLWAAPGTAAVVRARERRPLSRQGTSPLVTPGTVADRRRGWTVARAIRDRPLPAARARRRRIGRPGIRFGRSPGCDGLAKQRNKASKNRKKARAERGRSPDISVFATFYCARLTKMGLFFWNNGEPACRNLLEIKKDLCYDVA